jgi:hypothetical protein
LPPRPQPPRRAWQHPTGGGRARWPTGRTRARGALQLAATGPDRAAHPNLARQKGERIRAPCGVHARRKGCSDAPFAGCRVDATRLRRRSQRPPPRAVAPQHPRPPPRTEERARTVPASMMKPRRVHFVPGHGRPRPQRTPRRPPPAARRAARAPAMPKVIGVNFQVSGASALARGRTACCPGRRLRRRRRRQRRGGPAPVPPTRGGKGLCRCT